jgi:glycerol-3-phosphate cytidylyltransferase
VTGRSDAVRQRPRGPVPAHRARAAICGTMRAEHPRESSMSEPTGQGVAPTRRVLTFGTFDVLHVGHVAILERARALGDRLIVGVSSDALNVAKKGRQPVYSQDDRIKLIGALRCVDEVFVEASLELKGDYLREHRADVLVMGDDWAGRFDEFKSLCEVVYLPRTPSISTTEIIEVIRRAT